MHKLGIFGFVLGAVILFACHSARANDTLVREGVGGIEFVKSDDIRMLEEVLEISDGWVRVKYRFINESDKDIHTTVAFPMPRYPRAVPTTYYQGHEGLESTFKVQVDGRPVSTTTVRKAMIADQDVTAQLRELGFSDRQIFDIECTEWERLTPCNITKEQEVALKRLWPTEHESVPWDIDVTMYWEQTFPAGKEIVVEHEYAPISGAIWDLPDTEPDYFRCLSDKANAEACLDDRTKRAIENRIKAYRAKGDKGGGLTQNDVEYILGTGRNWKGPIKEFTLRVKKDSPDQIISLCFPGDPKKLSPTVYEFHHKDFVPPDNVVVYFYTVGKEVHQ